MLTNLRDVSTIISWTLAIMALAVTMLPEGESAAAYVPALKGTLSSELSE